jgi:hypothetical protein
MSARKRGGLSRPFEDWIAPKVAQLLDLFLAAAKEVDRPYAIGGALAMGVHGYRRTTDDVDAYVEHKDRIEWVRALRDQGLTVAPLFAGVHYVAYLPEHNDPEGFASKGLAAYEVGRLIPKFGQRMRWRYC